MSTKSGALTRSIAIDALSHVLHRRQHADVALDRLFKSRPSLSALDRAFVYEMVYGSLRWLSKMDWILSHMIDRPFSSLDPRVANALRVGTYQIFYMDRVPDRAAVAETVEAAKLVGAAPASSLVNAVLRRVSRKAEYFQKPDKESDTLRYLSMHHAHPEWMIKRWMKHIPRDRLDHVLTSHNRPPMKTLRQINKRSLPTEENLATFLLRTQGIHSEWRPLKTSLRVEELPRFAECEAFQAGCYIVQDESAQLAASLVRPKKGERVLDACASPGGKAMAVWDQAETGVSFFLCDAAKKRLPVLHENLNRLQLLEESFEVAHADATEAFGDTTFHHIVLDAPCTAMGVMSRHPEIKWHRSLPDVAKCAAEQKRLLDGLAPRLLKGGEMIYMVCSFEPEETEMQMENFLERHPDFSRVDLNTRIHDYYRKYLSSSGDLLVMSGNQDKIDGFYACVLQKKE